MIERSAKVLQIRLDICEYVAPLRRGITYGTTPFLKGSVVVSSSCVAGKENKPLRSRNDCTPSPWHQAVSLELLVGHKLHLSLPGVSTKQSKQNITRALEFEPSTGLGGRGHLWHVDHECPCLQLARTCRSEMSATRPLSGGDLNRSTQHLLILLDKEVADGDVTDIVHGEAEG